MNANYLLVNGWKYEPNGQEEHVYCSRRHAASKNELRELGDLGLAVYREASFGLYSYYDATPEMQHKTDAEGDVVITAALDYIRSRK